MELNLDTAAEYLRMRGIAFTSIDLLAGGVSNTVLKVDTEQGRPFILKQSLPKLRVKDEWIADRSRIFREINALVDLASFMEDLPKVLWVDDSNYLFAMTAVVGRPWKSLLLEGQVEDRIAVMAAEQMALFIRSTWQSRFYQDRYGDQTSFYQLRIDPFYKFLGVRHPEVAERVSELLNESSGRNCSLVHGDWSPKNLLVSENHLYLIDFEVVHFGDPTFDAAFLIHHLLLKWFYLPRHRDQISRIARIFWAKLLCGLPTSANSFFEKATLQHLGLLLLARVDGKSPAEYLTGRELQETVRSAARELIFRPPETLYGCLDGLDEWSARSVAH